jgi:hypothetical protein
MYKVIWKDALGKECERDFDNLDPAMEWAKILAVFVTIKGNEYDIVGRFGVDAVVNGVCPDGVRYDWNKANRIGRTRRTR